MYPICHAETTSLARSARQPSVRFGVMKKKHRWRAAGVSQASALASKNQYIEQPVKLGFLKTLIYICISMYIYIHTYRYIRKIGFAIVAFCMILVAQLQQLTQLNFKCAQNPADGPRLTASSPHMSSIQHQIHLCVWGDSARSKFQPFQWLSFSDCLKLLLQAILLSIMMSARNLKEDAVLNNLGPDQIELLKIVSGLLIITQLRLLFSHLIYTYTGHF